MIGILHWLARRVATFAGAHVYLSTACLHGRHDYCNAPTVTRDGQWAVLDPSYSSERDATKAPAACKFCKAPCICRCHNRVKGSAQ